MKWLGYFGYFLIAFVLVLFIQNQFGSKDTNSQTSLRTSTQQVQFSETEAKPRGSATVSINEMKVVKIPGVNDVGLLFHVTIKNNMDKEWHANRASFTISTPDGLTFKSSYGYTYDNLPELQYVDLQKEQRAEGVILFDGVPESPNYTITYSKYRESIQFNIPGTEEEFTPIENTIENY